MGSSGKWNAEKLGELEILLKENEDQISSCTLYTLYGILIDYLVVE